MKILERSPKVGPLLSRLYDHNNSYHAAAEGDDTGRIDLSNVMVDLLCLDLPASESELVTDVLLELMRQAEHDLRLALAERLAPLDGVPLRMVLHLANDDISIADPILRNSPVLQDMDLIYIIKSHQATHWQSIARRNNLSGPVINVLAETGDIGTAVTLAENKAITLTEYALDLFVPMAGMAEQLARPLLTRPELPQTVAAKLYEVVGAELKKTLEERFAVNSEAVSRAIDDIVAEAQAIAQENFLPSHNIVRAAEHLKEQGNLHPGTMLSSLKRGMISSFIAQFAAYAELPVETVNDLLQQKTGQSLAVACKATGIKKADFISFYLMSHRARQAVQPVITNQEFSVALRTYDAISQEDALRLLRQPRTLN